MDVAAHQPSYPKVVMTYRKDSSAAATNYDVHIEVEVREQEVLAHFERRNVGAQSGERAVNRHLVLKGPAWTQDVRSMVARTEFMPQSQTSGGADYRVFVWDQRGRRGDGVTQIPTILLEYRELSHLLAHLADDKPLLPMRFVSVDAAQNKSELCLLRDAASRKVSLQFFYDGKLIDEKNLSLSHYKRFYELARTMPPLMKDKEKCAANLREKGFYIDLGTKYFASWNKDVFTPEGGRQQLFLQYVHTLSEAVSLPAEFKAFPAVQ